MEMLMYFFPVFDFAHIGRVADGRGEGSADGIFGFT
jgi:hypothetical protein